MKRPLRWLCRLLLLVPLLSAALAPSAMAQTSGCPTVALVGCVALGTGTAVIGSMRTLPPVATAFTSTSCVVGTSSGACLGASTAVNSLTIQNISAAATIACVLGGTPVLNGTGFMLLPGQARSWNLTTSGVPAQALVCIASTASTPLYLEYN